MVIGGDGYCGWATALHLSGGCCTHLESLCSRLAGWDAGWLPRAVPAAFPSTPTALTLCGSLFPLYLQPVATPCASWTTLHAAPTTCRWVLHRFVGTCVFCAVCFCAVGTPACLPYQLELNLTSACFLMSLLRAAQLGLDTLTPIASIHDRVRK